MNQMSQMNQMGQPYAQMNQAFQPMNQAYPPIMQPYPQRPVDTHAEEEPKSKIAWLSSNETKEEPTSFWPS